LLLLNNSIIHKSNIVFDETPKIFHV